MNKVIQFKFLVIGLALTALTSCATDSLQMKLTPESNKGAILIKVKPSTLYSELAISPFNPIEETRASGGSAFFRFDKASSDGYLIDQVNPGTHVIWSISQQDEWTACFHRQTLSFEVRPGQIVYIGEFDQRPYLGQIQALAVKNRDFFTKLPIFYLDNIMPPRLSPVTDTSLASAKTFVSNAMPNANAPVVAAKLEPARFATGYSLFGERVCGGYNKKIREDAGGK